MIDYYDWTQEQGISYNPLATHAVTVSDVKKIMEEKNIQPQQGDIFILRTGELLVFRRENHMVCHLTIRLQAMYLHTISLTQKHEPRSLPIFSHLDLGSLRRPPNGSGNVSSLRLRQIAQHLNAHVSHKHFFPLIESGTWGFLTQVSTCSTCRSAMGIAPYPSGGLGDSDWRIV